MKTRLLPALVLTVIGLTVQAKAATLVYLVGLRHVYAIPAYPDVHQIDRQNIEENYAAAVEGAQKQYDADMASIHDEEAKDSGNVHQQDRDQVQMNLEKDISDAADKREAALADIYPLADSLRASHPEFAVEQDGPYRVIEVESAPSGEFTNVVYYQPYPMYVDVCPFGWVWGQPYPYMTWGVQIRTWHGWWLSVGCPFYAPMYYDGAVFVVNAPIRSEVVLNRSGWNGGRPPQITEVQRTAVNNNLALQRKSGYFNQGPGGRQLSEFVRPSAAGKDGVSKYSRGATASSRYSHSLSGAPTSRYGQTGASSSSAASGASRYGRTGTGSSSTSTGTSRYSRTGSGTTGSSTHGPTGSGSSSGSKSTNPPPHSGSQGEPQKKG